VPSESSNSDTAIAVAKSSAPPVVDFLTELQSRVNIARENIANGANGANGDDIVESIDDRLALQKSTSPVSMRDAFMEDIRNFNKHNRLRNVSINAGTSNKIESQPKSVADSLIDAMRDRLTLMRPAIAYDDDDDENNGDDGGGSSNSSGTNGSNINLSDWDP